MTDNQTLFILVLEMKREILFDQAMTRLSDPPVPYRQASTSHGT